MVKMRRIKIVNKQIQTFVRMTDDEQAKFTSFMLSKGMSSIGDAMPIYLQQKQNQTLLVHTK